MNVISKGSLEEFKIFNFPTSEGLLFLKAMDIISIESDENYSFVKHVSGREFVLLSLKKVEAYIESPMYFRCHRSYIINLEKIKSYDKVANRMTMSNGETIPVSRIRKSDLMKHLERLYNLEN